MYQSEIINSKAEMDERDIEVYNWGTMFQKKESVKIANINQIFKVALELAS